MERINLHTSFRPNTTLDQINQSNKQIEAGIPSVNELLAIPVNDNGDPMVKLNNDSDLEIRFDNYEAMIPIIGRNMFIREQVSKLLTSASQKLIDENDQYRLLLFYAYRAPQVQTKYYNSAKAKVNADPQIPATEKFAFTHTLAAYPPVAVPPITIKSY